MRTFDDTMQDLLDLVDEENLVVTTAVVQLEDEEDYYEAQAARVEYDGIVRGVITYDGMEMALDVAAQQMYSVVDGEEEEDCFEDEEHFSVSTRHIESLQAMVDELGFDHAVALLERLNK